MINNTMLGWNDPIRSAASAPSSRHSPVRPCERLRIAQPSNPTTAASSSTLPAARFDTSGAVEKKCNRTVA